MIEQAREAWEHGLKVFPLHGAKKKGDEWACNCGNPKCVAIFKHPRMSNWQNVPHWDEEQVDNIEEAGWFDTGYGILCKGLLVIDVDARNGGIDSFSNLIEDFPEISGSGMIVLTGSGGGSKHLYFSVSPDIPMVTHHPKYPGIDFRSGSSFVVGVGSHHASGNSYSLAVGSFNDIDPAPEALVAALRKPDRHRAEYDGRAVDVSHSDIAGMLAHVSPDCGYDQWIRIGMAVHHSTGGTGFDLWDGWSAKGAKYDGDRMESHWHSFGRSANPVTLGTLVHHAEQGGWVWPVTFDDADPDRAGDPEDDPLGCIDVSGVDLKRPPGFAGKVAAWIGSKPIMPRDHIAVGAALYALGAVYSLHYTSQTSRATTNLLAFCVAGSRCHAPGTMILMSDGSTRAVEDVLVGDTVMGPDSMPRVVLELATGHEEMALISPNRGEPFVVNMSHILSLERTGKDGVIRNISVRDWMAAGTKFKSKWKLRRCAVDLPEKNLLIPPYVMGAMLGDGCTVATPFIVGADNEIHDEVTSFARSIGLNIRRQQASGNAAWASCMHVKKGGREKDGSRGRNPFTALLEIYGINGVRAAEKFIPHDYKTGSKAQRLDVLAGLIDTDGSLGGKCYDFISKSKALADDVVFIARSLGLSAQSRECTKSSLTGFTGQYFRVMITGNTDIIPVRVPRKKAARRTSRVNAARTGFSVRRLPVGRFFGFNLSGDHLYLTGDFIAHHNTGKESIEQGAIDVIRAAGLTDMIAGKFKSEQEIIRNLVRNQASFHVVDEIGLELQKLKNAQARGGTPYLEGIVGTIMSAYGKSNGVLPLTGDAKEEVRDTLRKRLAQLERKKAENDGGPNIDQMIRQVEEAMDRTRDGLVNPLLGVIGFTTPVTFDGLLDFVSGTNGFVGRSLIFVEHDTTPKPRKHHLPPDMPDDVARTILMLGTGGQSDQSGRIEHYGPRTVIPDTQAARDMLAVAAEWLHGRAVAEKSETGLESLWLGSYELVEKVSLILAVPEGLRTEEHVRWAFALIRRDVETKIRSVTSNDRARDNPLMALQSKIMNLCGGDDGERLGVIVNRCRGYRREDVVKAIAGMVEAGTLTEEKGGGSRGPKSSRFRAG